MNNTQEIAQWIVDNCICIDTETTGLGENDVVVEIAAIQIGTGRVLVDTVVKPIWLTDPKAEETHGITWEEQEGGQDFKKVLDQLHGKSKFGPDVFTAFNLQFDERLIRQTMFRLGEPFPPLNEYATKVRAMYAEKDTESKKPEKLRVTEVPETICIMELANRHFAKDHAEWDNENSRFRRLSLAKCCEIAGVEFTGTAHRALADARAAADLVIAIAEGRC